MYSSLAHALSSYMVRSAWTCLIALQLPILETGVVVFIDDLSERTLMELCGRVIQKQLK